MSENNYGALMMKSVLAAGDDINAIKSPGIYIVPGGSTSSPGNAGGILIVCSGSPVRRTFVAVDTDAITQLATLAAVQSAVSALELAISLELAKKQPADSTLTNLSGKDVAGLLAFLGLSDVLHLGNFGIGKSKSESAAQRTHAGSFFYEPGIQGSTLYPASVAVMESGGPTQQEWGQLAIAYGADFKAWFARQTFGGSLEVSEIFHDKRKPTNADVGSYPATGGNLNGNLSATGTVTSGPGKDMSAGQDLWAGRDLYANRNLHVTGAATLGSLTVNGDTATTGNIDAGGYVRSAAGKDVVSQNDIWATRNATVGKDLTVVGTAAITGDIDCGGGVSSGTGKNITSRNDIVASRHVTVGQNLTVGGSATVTGNVDATGYVRSGVGSDVVSQNDFWAARYIYENGLRVYSPGNPPPAKFSKALNTVSWEKNLETGVITIWGFVDVGDNAYVTVNLPIAFPSSFLSLLLTPAMPGAFLGQNVVSAGGKIINSSSFGCGISSSVDIPWTGIYFEAKGV